MRPSLNKKSSSASMMMMSNSAFIPKEIRYLVHLCTPQYNSIMVNKFKWVEISIRVSPHNQFFSKIPPTYFLILANGVPKSKKKIDIFTQQ